MRQIKRGVETSESISSEETEKEEQLKLVRELENLCQWPVSRQYTAFVRKDMHQDSRLRKRGAEVDSFAVIVYCCLRNDKI